MRTFTLSNSGKKIAVNPRWVSDVEESMSTPGATVISIVHGSGNVTRVVRESFEDVVRELSL